MPHRASVLSSIALVLSLTLAPALASGADKKSDRRARDLFQKGQTAYDVGDFKEALDAYTAAYKEKPLPAFVFNIAQCHRQLHAWEKAAFFYRRYLTLMPNAPNAQQARDLLSEVEKSAAEEKKAADTGGFAAAPVSPSTSEVSTPQPAGVPPPPPPASTTSPTPAPAGDVPLASSAATTRTVSAHGDPDAVHVVPSGATAGETEKKVEPAPFYKEWWFWTAVGVVVIAGAVAATAYGASAGGSPASQTCPPDKLGSYCISLR